MLQALQKLLRVEPGISLGQWAHDRVANNWQALVALVGGGGSITYLAAITEWLNAWGPIAWGVAFLAGVLLVALIFAIYYWTSERRARSTMLNQLVERPKKINPLEQNFDKQVIDANDFFMPLPPLYYTKGQVFTDCIIKGPATVLFVGTSQHYCGYDGSCQAIAVKQDALVANCVLFFESTFRNTRFYNLTILVPEPTVQSLKEGVPGLRWLDP